MTDTYQPKHEIPAGPFKCAKCGLNETSLTHELIEYHARICGGTIQS
jgi:hypothetical protein